MTDNLSPGPFVLPLSPGYPPPYVNGDQASGHPQAGGQPYPTQGLPGHYPPPGGQWNQQWPVPNGAAPPPAERNTGKLVIGIVLTVFGGLAIVSQLSPAAIDRRAESASSSGLAYHVGYLGSFLVFAVVPLVVGIIMIVRSKLR